MAREEAKRRAEVMLAWANGAEIECRDVNSDSCPWEVYPQGFEPLWFWGHYDYRVYVPPVKKPNRPWTPEEAVGQKVRHHTGTLSIITSAYTDGCFWVAFSGRHAWLELSAFYTRPNGSPIGEPVE